MVTKGVTVLLVGSVREESKGSVPYWELQKRVFPRDKVRSSYIHSGVLKKHWSFLLKSAYVVYLTYL